MKYVVNAKEMKQIDADTICNVGIPSLVLMEKAAEKVADRIKELCSKSQLIGVVCGTGNNGGDGIAVARILHLQGYQVEIVLPFESAKATEEVKKQLEISKNLKMSIRTQIAKVEYNIIVDAIFGIGLQREITGDYEEIIQWINDSGASIVSVDIPSGINASNGKVMGVAVKADITVTFGEMKLGLLLYPGASYSGRVLVEDIGFPDAVVQKIAPNYICFEKEDFSKIPGRKDYSNKGTYGKVLVIAGSKNMTGAAYFSAAAAYRMGCGLVKVISSDEGVNVIRQKLPEALYASYETHHWTQIVLESLQWADVVVIGPGLSKSNTAVEIVDFVIEKSEIPIILDADALGILANQLNEQQYLHPSKRIEALSKRLKKGTILTPHLKELSNLISMDMSEVVSDFIDIPELCTYNNELIYVLKDARTIVATGYNRYINITGNHGMASGGSGDILTGIISGLIAMGMNSEEAARLGVFIHGYAGDIAAEHVGHYSMLASDIIEALAEVMKEYEGRRI